MCKQNFFNFPKIFIIYSYKMMYNEDILKIPIQSLLNSTGIVAVWCTNSSSQLKYIVEEIFPSWNIIYKAKWYWLKV
jgi:N6-adenosine-specific RNA methylase IME4